MPHLNQAVAQGLEQTCAAMMCGLARRECERERIQMMGLIGRHAVNAAVFGAFAGVLLAPCVHHLDNRYQRFAKIGKRVFHFRWHLWIDFTVHDAVVFQFAQLQRQHALGDVGQEAAQFIEALRAAAQVVQNQNFPFTTDDGQGGGDGAAAAGRGFGIA